MFEEDRFMIKVDFICFLGRTQRKNERWKEEELPKY